MINYFKKKFHHPEVPPRSLMDSFLSDPKFSRRSYSQCGEDLIVAFIFHSLGIENIKYLDIGAYSPRKLSNTYYFYERGHSGVCVEANTFLANDILKERNKDVVLNVAVSPNERGQLPFYVLNPNTLSTLSLIEASRLESEEGASIISENLVDVIPVNELIASQFPKRDLNFVSLDVEGIDLTIIQAFDFNFCRPLVFCLETLEYKKSGKQEKNESFSLIMKQNGYFLYADTYINSIYVDSTSWFSR